MKNLGYKLVKYCVKLGLHLYHGKIIIEGLENIPKDKPVLFLPNHQNALIDVLLIATDCIRKPYFLTRSDLFKGSALKSIFSFFQMIPIYRMRDGRESLKNNEAIFDTCAALFEKKEAILMFPEANHNLKRRVRPLSKGFTRILFNAMDKNPDLDIHIIPVGLNYSNSLHFPDKAAVYFDTPIRVLELYDASDIKSSTEIIKAAVSSRMKKLTTHIADDDRYEEIENKLDALSVDFLKPNQVNATIASLNTIESPKVASKVSVFKWLLATVFLVLNAPILLLWRLGIKPKVWEPEFTGTLRFGFALLAYPIYYVLLFVVVSMLFSSLIALGVILGIILFNWLYVRLN